MKFLRMKRETVIVDLSCLIHDTFFLTGSSIMKLPYKFKLYFFIAVDQNRVDIGKP